MNYLKKQFAIILGTVFIVFNSFAQTSVPEGWHVKDLKSDGYYGISLDKAYEFVKTKQLKSTPVIVGIIDSGIDTTHEDLKSALWINKKEIAGNGKDDDGNGYIDDVYGWNFLGSKDGKQNVEKDSYEAARVYWKYKEKFDNKTAEQISVSDLATYQVWLKAKKDVSKDVNLEELSFIKQMADVLKTADATIKKDLKKEVYSCKDLKGYSPTTLPARQLKEVLLGTCNANDTEDLTNKMLLDEVQKDLDKMTLTQAPPPSYRSDVVRDYYDDFNDQYYGNSNVYVTEDGAVHGTHVAGIIGAVRNNGIGINGVADNVKLMAIRAVPDGDEHDKDIALAIRYAVDNGARVINMSFGKSFSPEKHWVDEAVRYADSKGVLLVHAAGNDAANIDTTDNFPSKAYLDGKTPTNWITVGASGDEKAGGLTANFSNYGKKEVDVFAPGVRIYATLPSGNNYGNLQGTSMASPVVAGLAAFIMSYYPNLSATQVRDIIMKSVSKPSVKVANPGNGEKVWLSDISVTGGIVNAYEAIKLASTYGSSDIKKTAVKKKTVVKKTVKKK